MLRKILFLGSILLICNQDVSARVDSQQAETFMKNIGDKVISLLTNQTLSSKERATQFQEILETKFNLKAIGKFVLGRYWKHASDEEKEKFLELFKATTIATYTMRFKEYTSEKFEVIGSRPEQDGGITVLTQITRPNGQPILIDWKIFEKKEELRIYDVILEGISMGITQRSEFASFIQKGGHGIGSLLAALEEKVQNLKKTK